MKKDLTKEQKNIVEQIMQREPRQARVDAIVRKAKKENEDPEQTEKK